MLTTDRLAELYRVNIETIRDDTGPVAFLPGV
jgi:hypothetical protein